PTYPPAAHSKLAMSDNPVAEQPTPTTEMVVSRATQGQEQQRAARLRGGCIPCPVS
ncbi:hypothetical protein AMATHDRAFT_95288, partial [Amanita thiersii Skay4041]